MTSHFATRLRRADRGRRRRNAVRARRTTSRAPSAAVTAQEIVDRIKKNIGVEWSSDDVDTFKVGDPSTVVTGVVTTSMATLDVLQKAVQAGANFVITGGADVLFEGGPEHARRPRPRRGRRRRPRPAARREAPAPGAARGRRHPATRQRARHRRLGAHAAGTRDATVGRAAGQPPAAAAAPATPPPPDPVYAGKNDFIAKHKLVVFRLTQHWNQRKPDPRAQGLATAMGWTKYKAGDDALRYDVPAITLDALASQLKKTPRHARRHPRDRRSGHDGAAHRAAAGVHA